MDGRKRLLGRTGPALLAPALVAMLICCGQASATPTITEYPLPSHGTQPLVIAAGPDGNVWFTEATGPGAIGRITPSGGVTEFTSGLNAPAAGIVAGSNGELWFAEPSSGKIGEITTSGSIKEFNAAKGSEPHGITAGQEGDLWFTEQGNHGAIGRITTAGSVTEFTTGLTQNSRPEGIATGPEGDLWFTELANPGRIGRITPSGAITEFTTGLTHNSEPDGIATGPEGDLWFTESANPGRIGRITPSGTITEFTSGLTTDVEPAGIGAGNDGNIYFAEPSGVGEIGEIAPAGTITERDTPTLLSEPLNIVTGGDGKLWFTELGGFGQIGTMTVAPGVTGALATSVSEQTATLEAHVDPDSQASTYRFEYGTTTSYGTQTTSGSAGSGSSAVTVSTPISGLAPGTLYHFRALATNATGTTDGADQTFTTASPPTATTQPATAVMLTSAMLNATVNPQGHATTYHFEWGETTAYGGKIPASDASVGSDASKHALENELTGLLADHTYHFRVVASNCGGCAEGTSYGADQAFTTASPPSAATETVEAVGLTSATLTGTVNPRGAATTYHFDWGETTAYGNEAPLSDASVGSDSSVHELSQTLTELHPGTTYHYRIVASNCSGCQAGTTYGADISFTTIPAPALTTQAPQGVALTGATMSGSVNPLGQSTTYHFDWGETTAYGNEAPLSDASVGSDSSVHELSQTLTELHPGTTYHYRIVASNCSGCQAGTTYGADISFTTIPAPALTTQAPQGVALTGATMSGSVNPLGQSTTYHFDWGETTAYGNEAPLSDASVGSDSSVHELSQTLTELHPGTTYHYRIVASNCSGCQAGTTYGADISFTTAIPVLPAPFSGPGGPTRTAALTQASGLSSPLGSLGSAVAPPELGHTALAQVLSGTVLVRVAGSRGERALGDSADVPVGSFVDATHGVAVLTLAAGGGASQSVTVWAGAFTLRQRAASGGMTTFVMPPPSRAGCRRRGAGAARASAASARTPAPAPNLWAKDHGGHFSTRGQNSVATVRGTEWASEERCDGTLTIVRRGLVSVRSLRTHQTVMVHAGRRWLARG